jgi:hypothetical protein
MNITPKRIKAIYDRHQDLSWQIGQRWAKLIGFGCGHFSDFTIDGDYIRVNFSLRQNSGYDLIHNIYFVMPGDVAKKAFDKCKREKIDSFGSAWQTQKYLPPEI